MQPNGRCRDCGRGILWASVPGGRAVALEPRPHPRGSRALDAEGNAGPPEGAGGGHADRSVRYLPHYLACEKRRRS